MIVEPNKFANDPFPGTAMQSTLRVQSQSPPLLCKTTSENTGTRRSASKDGGLYYQRIGGSGAALRATGVDKFTLNTMPRLRSFATQKASLLK